MNTQWNILAFVVPDAGVVLPEAKRAALEVSTNISLERTCAALRAAAVIRNGKCNSNSSITCIRRSYAAGSNLCIATTCHICCFQPCIKDDQQLRLCQSCCDHRIVGAMEREC